MKNEINIVKNGDENPQMIVTTPSSDEIVVRDIPEGAYQVIDDTSLEDIMTGVSMLFRHEKEGSKVGFQVQVFKDKVGDENVCQMMMRNLDADKDGMIDGCATIIPKKEYKRYCKGTLLDRFEMACNYFIEIAKAEKETETP